MQNAQELKEMFSFKEHYPSNFFATESQLALQDKYENKLFNIKLVNLYDKVKEGLGRIPTLKEFGVEYAKCSYNYVMKHVDVKDEDVNYLLDCIKWRTERCYKSRIYEEYVLLKLKELYPDFDFYTHHLIDDVMGVDIVAVDAEGHFYYIHITKNTQAAIDKMYLKVSHTNFKFGKKRLFYVRRIKDHIILKYTTSGFTEIKKEIMDQKFARAKTWENTSENYLRFFNEKLIDKEIVSKDFRFISEKGRVLEIDE